MAKFNFVVLLGVVAAAIGMVSAVTEEERIIIRLAVLPILASCGQETGITKEEVLAAKENNNLDALNPCFYACFFKKINTINSEGLFDPATAKEKHQKYFHGKDDLAKLDAMVDTCTAVNDQAVTDGSKGCDRAKLLIRCFVDNKSSFTPFAI